MKLGTIFFLLILFRSPVTALEIPENQHDAIPLARIAEILVDEKGTFTFDEITKKNISGSQNRQYKYWVY
jgi:hypothetical protein